MSDGQNELTAPLIENPTSPNANLEMDGQNVSGG